LQWLNHILEIQFFQRSIHVIRRDCRPFAIPRKIIRTRRNVQDKDARRAGKGCLGLLPHLDTVPHSPTYHLGDTRQGRLELRALVVIVGARGRRRGGDGSFLALAALLVLALCFFHGRCGGRDFVVLLLLLLRLACGHWGLCHHCGRVCHFEVAVGVVLSVVWCAVVGVECFCFCSSFAQADDDVRLLGLGWLGWLFRHETGDNKMCPSIIPRFPRRKACGDGAVQRVCGVG
jgi:hypothetical protein